MKQTISVIILLLTVSMSAFAQEFLYNGIAYTVLSEEDKTVEVGASSSFNGSELIIPEKVTYSGKEYTVTGIGESAFFYNTSVTSVSIPATVKTIGNSAFKNCSNLTSLTFEGESQLEQISQYAFQSTGLTTIKIPATVKTIECLAFADNTALRQIYMHSNNPSGYDKSAFERCGSVVIYAPIASYENYKNQFSYNKVEVELTEWKTYAENEIKEGLNALNTLSDEDRGIINKSLATIREPLTFDDAYNAFKTAMPIINAQINFEKNLKTAIGNLGTRQNGPAIRIVGEDGTTIQLFKIKKVDFIKVNE